MSRAAFALPFAWLSLALGLAGCPATVSLSEVDGFSGVASAVWLQASYRGGSQEVVILSETPSLCAKLQDDLPAYEDLLYDYAHHEDPCVAAPDFYGDVADLTAPYQREGRSVLTLAVWGADGPGTALAEGEWAHDNDHVLELWLSHVRENPAAVAERQWSDGACATDAEMVEEAVDRWYLSAGSLTLGLATESRLRGSLEGELADELGQAAGTLDLTFGARACPVDLDATGLHLFHF
jgi:hypothetical protein